MQITEAATAPMRGTDDGGRVREGGTNTKVMLTGREGDPRSYKLVLAETVNEYRGPRHRHDLDQVHFVLEGEYVYGQDNHRVLRAGSIGYFPEGVHYGPEIRRVGLLEMHCLFIGASKSTYISNAQRKAAIDALKRTGEFVNGVFTYFDAEGQRHNQDAAEAVWEQAMGRRIEYPPPRYNDIITMNPANFTWVDEPGRAGVAVKRLGTFTERNTSIGLIRLQPGAAYDAGTHVAAELLFLAKGAVRCHDRVYQRHTAFGFEAEDGPSTLTAVEPSEIFYLQLPVLS